MKEAKKAEFTPFTHEEVIEILENGDQTMQCYGAEKMQMHGKEITYQHCAVGLVKEEFARRYPELVEWDSVGTKGAFLLFWKPDVKPERVRVYRCVLLTEITEPRMSESAIVIWNDSMKRPFASIASYLRERLHATN